MIEVSNVTKLFDDYPASNQLNMKIEKGSIYGLIGPNGSGKTTIIKQLMGIIKPDDGSILYDDRPIWENNEVKEDIGFIPDQLYFPNGYSLRNMKNMYVSMYPIFNEDRYDEMVKAFKLNEKMKLRGYSKGMKKQAMFILVMCTMPDYLILDEPIDGLDPIVRKRVWKYIIDDVADRGMSVLVSSHNLKELEGICDHIGIINKGRMLMECELDELQTDVHKIQVSFGKQTYDDPYKGLNVLHKETRGSIDMMIIKGQIEEIDSVISPLKPVLFDVLPLTLEELFIYELGGEDSDVIDLIF